MSSKSEEFNWAEKEGFVSLLYNLNLRHLLSSDATHLSAFSLVFPIVCISSSSSICSLLFTVPCQLPQQMLFKLTEADDLSPLQQHYLAFPSCFESCTVQPENKQFHKLSFIFLSHFHIQRCNTCTHTPFSLCELGLFTKNVPKEPLYWFCLMLKILFLDKLNMSFELCTQHMRDMLLLPGRL